MNSCPKCGVENPPFNDVCRRCDAPLDAPAGSVGMREAPPEVQPVLSAREPDAWPKPPSHNAASQGHLVPAPGWLRIIGVLSILLGVGIPLANYFFVKDGIDKFIDKGFSEEVVLPLWINIWLSAGIGVYLLIAGLGLLGPTRWGRWMSMLFIGIAILGAVVAMVNGVITKVMAEEEFTRKHQHAMFASFHIKYFAAAPFFPPGFGALLLVLSLLPPVRDWARGKRVVEGGPSPSEAGAPASSPVQLHSPAMVSMVLSMIPFLLITQIVSLIMGIAALRTIGRSEGKLTGRGFAWAGIIISSLILSCMGSIIGIAVVGAAVAPNSVEERRPTYDSDRTNEKTEKVRFDD